MKTEQNRVTVGYSITDTYCMSHRWKRKSLAIVINKHADRGLVRPRKRWAVQVRKDILKGVTHKTDAWR